MVNWVGVFSRGREGTYKNVGVEKKGVGQKPKNKKKGYIINVFLVAYIL